MTPIIDDLLTAVSFVYEAGIKLYCYIFGHKWGKWEDSYGGYENSPLGQTRQCNRCCEYNHDSQRLKDKCKLRPTTEQGKEEK